MADYQIESGACHGRGFAGLDANGFLAKFYTWVTKSAMSGGPGWYIIDDQSSIANPYIVVCDIASPVVNDIDTGKAGGPPKFIKISKIDAESGKIRAQYYCWWDTGTHIGQGLFAGYFINTYDDADFAYDFRGGDECMIIQSRLGTAWDSAMLDEWLGDTNLVEATTKVGVLQSGVVAGSDVVLQLNTGEAANFTLNKYYYIYDFNGHTWANYCKCTNVNTGLDQITVGLINQNFPTGSVVCAYVHRWMASGNHLGGWTADLNSPDYCSRIPYYSSISDQTRVIHNQTSSIQGASFPAIVYQYVIKMAPNDEGVYAVMKPGVVEKGRPNGYAGDSENNRGYGTLKNLYVSALGSMARGLDGKVIAGNNWLYFQNTSEFMSTDSDIAALFLDTASSPIPPPPY